MRGKAVVLSLHPLYDTRIQNQLRSLVEAGFDTVLVNWSETGTFLTSQAFSHVRVIHRQSDAKTGGSTLKLIQMLWWFLQAIIKLKPAIVVNNELLLLPLAAPVRILTRAAFVFDIHEYFFRFHGRTARFARIAYKLSGPFVSGVILVAPDMENPSRYAPAVVIPNYQSRREFEAARLKASRNPGVTLCYFGSLSLADRDVMTLLQVAEICLRRSPIIYFELGGKLSGTGEEKVRELIRELEKTYASRFVWYGEMPRELVAERTAVADVGFWLMKEHPNILGASPNKIYEYLVAGLSVVATDGFADANLISASGAGLVFTPGAGAEEISERLVSFIATSLSSAKQASAQIGQELTFEALAPRFEKFWTDLDL